MGEEAKMNIIGYCKECSTIIRHEDRIDNSNVYECSKCKHPQTKEEVEFRPFEIKKIGRGGSDGTINQEDSRRDSIPCQCQTRRAGDRG